MTKGPIALLFALLALGAGINVWQGGAANRITLLGYTPLLLGIIYCVVRLVLAQRKP